VRPVAVVAVPCAEPYLSPMRRAFLQVCAALAVAAPTVDTAGAQDRGSVAGVVRDSAGQPIAGADVAIVALKLLTRTEQNGSFRFGRVSAGDHEISVRRMGFQPARVNVALGSVASDSLSIVLQAQAVVLAGVDVNGQDARHLLWIEEFYRRRVRGMGKYVTRDEIEARHASRLSDAVRNVPGLIFVRTRGGNGVRFASAAGRRRDCVPQVWVDAVRANGLELDDISARDVEGVELYHGPSTTPMQFSQGAISTCGTIVIWTRVPGT